MNRKSIFKLSISTEKHSLPVILLPSVSVKSTNQARPGQRPSGSNHRARKSHPRPLPLTAQQLCGRRLLVSRSAWRKQLIACCRCGGESDHNLHNNHLCSQGKRRYDTAACSFEYRYCFHAHRTLQNGKYFINNIPYTDDAQRPLV